MATMKMAAHVPGQRSVYNCQFVPCSQNQVTQCHGTVVTVVPTTMFYCYWSAGLNYDKKWYMQALKPFSITIHSLLQLSQRTYTENWILRYESSVGAQKKLPSVKTTFLGHGSSVSCVRIVDFHIQIVIFPMVCIFLDLGFGKTIKITPQDSSPGNACNGGAAS